MLCWKLANKLDWRLKAISDGWVEIRTGSTIAWYQPFIWSFISQAAFLKFGIIFKLTSINIAFHISMSPTLKRCSCTPKDVMRLGFYPHDSAFKLRTFLMWLFSHLSYHKHTQLLTLDYLIRSKCLMEPAVHFVSFLCFYCPLSWKNLDGSHPATPLETSKEEIWIQAHQDPFMQVLANRAIHMKAKGKVLCNYMELCHQSTFYADKCVLAMKSQWQWKKNGSGSKSTSYLLVWECKLSWTVL